MKNKNVRVRGRESEHFTNSHPFIILPSLALPDVNSTPSMAIAQTDRLILRPFAAVDLEDLAAILSLPEVMQFSLTGDPKTREETRRLIANILESYDLRGWGLWAVIHRADRALIGYCGLLHQSIAGVPEIEVGYRLHPTYWRCGLATEAAIAVRDYAFEILQVSRLIAIIQPENVRSIRVAEKLGMHSEQNTFYRGIPVCIYALTNPITPSNSPE